MTDFAAEYQALGQRREGIVSRIAVLRSNEERKKGEREQIEAELREAGIDPSKPDEEIERLTREVENHRNTISKELDEIENLLNPKVFPPEPDIQAQVDQIPDAEVDEIFSPLEDILID